jgi:tetratricopeptide (TPR) repeat protein
MEGNDKWTSYWESARRALKANKLEHAEPLLYSALDIAEDFDIDDPRLLMNLECLAEVLFKMGRLTQVEPVVKRIIMAYEKKYGREHPDVGVFTNNLGLIYHKQGKCFMAETEYQKALSIQTKLLGNSHPQTLNVMSNYARLLNETHRQREARHLEACIEGVKTGSWNQSGRDRAYQAENSVGTESSASTLSLSALAAKAPHPYRNRSADDVTLQDIKAASLDNSQHLNTRPLKVKASQQQGGVMRQLLRNSKEDA